MKILETKLVPPPEAEATRRITIELPGSRAEALAHVIIRRIVWHETAVEDELSGLYGALMGHES